jgi:XisI protein
MDSTVEYRKIIESVLQQYTQIVYANMAIKNRAAFDRDRDQYLILSEGWNKQQHIHSCLIHIEIINSKVWIQIDGTEDGIAEELMAAGIPKTEIVLGFHEPEIRSHTGFAIA